MLVQVDLQDKIYTFLKEHSDARGVSLEEGIRWLLGSFVLQATPPPEFRILPGFPLPFPSSAPPIAEDPGNSNEAMLRLAVVTSQPKCPLCTQRLKLEDIKKNKCSSCGESLI